MLGRIFGRGSAPEAVNKFSPAYFTHLHSLLSQQLARPSGLQADVCVSALKDLGEVMVWAGKSDGSDPIKARMSEMFAELAIMKIIVALHKAAYGTAPEVQQQVLQTLSIVLLNLGQEGGGSLFFLLSNGYINELMHAPFNDDDEEVLGYYISLLKTLSVTFNEGTVHFFFTRMVTRKASAQLIVQQQQDAAGSADFPMYTRAVAYADHSEGMVRAAVRTITLNVYRLADPAMHSYLLLPPHGHYPTTVAQRIRRLMLEANELAVAYSAAMAASGAPSYRCNSSDVHGCVGLLASASGRSRSSSGGSSTGSLPINLPRITSDLLHDVGDICDELYYLQDVLQLACTDQEDSSSSHHGRTALHSKEDSQAAQHTPFSHMASLFMDSFLNTVVRPLLIGDVGKAATSQASSSTHHTSTGPAVSANPFNDTVRKEELDPAFRLHMLSEVIKTVSYGPLRSAVLQLLGSPAPAAARCCGVAGPTVLDALLIHCVDGVCGHVLNAMLQLLHSVFAACDSCRQGHDTSRQRRHSAAGLSNAASGHVRETARAGRRRSLSLDSRAEHEAVGDALLDDHLHALRACAARWAVAIACTVSTVEADTSRSRMAVILLARMLARRHTDTVGGGLLCALAFAAQRLGTAVQDALVIARDEDPVAAIALLVALAHNAAQAMHASPVLCEAVATMEAEDSKYDSDTAALLQAGTSPPFRSPSPGAGADAAQQASALVQTLSGKAPDVDVSRACGPWSTSATANTNDTGSMSVMHDEPALWYHFTPAGVGPQHVAAVVAMMQSEGQFGRACRQLFWLRSLLALVVGPGVRPLLLASRGQLYSHAGPEVDVDEVADDLSYGTYVLDTGLRTVAPPIDSITPGCVFTLSAFPFFTAGHYPVATGAPSPVGHTEPMRDPVAPLSAAVASQRRVAVVLGQSYLVLAVVLAQKQGQNRGTGGSPGDAPPGTPRVRGKAVLVAPLHSTFVTPLSDAPTIVDVRVISADGFPPGTTQDLGPWQAGGAGEGSTSARQAGGELRVHAFALALDQLEAPSTSVHHVETARARILMSTVEEAGRLGRVDFRRQRAPEAETGNESGPGTGPASSPS